MSRIAHLSDLHLNGSARRSAKFVAALRSAKTWRPDHLILTGDLTSRGKQSELDELRGVLSKHWLGGTTIIPGNHDGKLSGFDSALTDLGDVVVLPIDTRVHRRALFFRALGQVGDAQMQHLESATRTGGRPILIAMHHGPQLHPLHVFDGLIDRVSMLGLLMERSHVFIACGHDHRVMDHSLIPESAPRIFVAASVAHHHEPLRIYDVTGSEIRPIYQSEVPGRYFTFGNLPVSK